MGSIELRCSICPSKPTFSDLSHLLTHVGSKGHLAHYFSAQVRASTDLSVHLDLDTYDQWFHRHGIDKLLSQRMKSKELRQQSRSARSTVTAMGPKHATSKFENQAVPLRNLPFTVPFTVDNSCIDPNLEAIGKSSAGNRSTVLQMQSSHYETHQASYQAPTAYMYTSQHAEPETYEGMSKPQLGNSHERFQSLSVYRPEGIKDIHHNENNTNGFKDWGYLNSSTHISMGTDSTNQTVQAVSGSSHSRHTSTSASIGDANPESHRLKGTVWPGMDIFDTADAESKRRRNQKKDKSTISRLATDSSLIQPTEVIYFYPSWDVKKSRYISGNVESSPPREPSLEQVHLPRTKRKPLREIDPNVPAKAQKIRHQRQKGTRAKARRPRKNAPGTSGSDEEVLDLMQPLFEHQEQHARSFKVFRDPTLSTPSRLPKCDTTLFSPKKLPATPIAKRGQELAAYGVKRTYTSTRGNSPCTRHPMLPMAYDTWRPHAGVGENKQAPTPPNTYHQLSPNGFDINMPILITPQRILLRRCEDQAKPVQSSESVPDLLDSLHHPQMSSFSPVGFSLVDLLAIRQEQASQQSPSHGLFSRCVGIKSPCNGKFSPRFPEDMMDTSSGEETIDLGIGES